MDIAYKHTSQPSKLECTSVIAVQGGVRSKGHSSRPPLALLVATLGVQLHRCRQLLHISYQQQAIGCARRALRHRCATHGSFACPWPRA